MNGISNKHTKTKESRKNIMETIIKLRCMMPNNNLSRRLREDDTNTVIQQLMNEADYLMKNYGDRGGCYHPPRTP